MEQDKQKIYKKDKVKSHLKVDKISPIGNDAKFINEVGMTIEEIRKKDKELDDLLKGADHIGDRKSRSEADFRTSLRLDYYRFDDNQRASILQRYRPYDKVFRLDYLMQTVDKARSSNKYNPDYTKVIEQNLTDIGKKEFDVLPQTVPDSHRWTLIKAPPRLGKTDRSMLWLAQNGNGVYCTNRHEIINHAMNIFQKYIPKGKTAVYLAGKDKCCNREGGVNCQNCPKCPHPFVGSDENLLSMGKAINTAYELLDEYRVLTPDLLMPIKNVCPYFMLMLAENAADYCFTIPFFLMNKDNIRGVKKANRNLLIIDEDPVCQVFYPQGYEIMSFSHVGRTSLVCSNAMISKIQTCDAIEKVISDKKRIPWVDKELLRMINILNQIDGLVADFINKKHADDSEDLLEAIRAIDISNEYTSEQKHEIKKKLQEYEREIDGGRDSNIYDVFAPLIHVGKISFVWVGNRPKSLHFVADREILYIPEENYEHVVIIGATESEMYIKEACGKDYKKESQIIEINSFKYSKNFMIMKLESDKKKTETKMFYRLMNMLIQSNKDNEKGGNPVVPFLVLESSKMKQESLQKHLKSRCICSSDDTEIDQFFNWETGKANVFYSNSTLSRGLDIPFYDVIFADALNFAVPYWNAMKEYWKDQGNTNMVYECNVIITKIISDEVTNSVLRCSPTMDYEFDPINHPGIMSTKEDDVKIIVIRNADASKILPNVMQSMREMQIIFPSGGNIEELDSVLHQAHARLSAIPKKVSRAVNLSIRDQSAIPLSHRPYCILFLNKYQRSGKDIGGMSGIRLSKLDEFLESEEQIEAKFKANALVDPEIKDRVLKDPGLVKSGKRAEKSLISNLMRGSKGKINLTADKIKKALGIMVRASLLRSTFEDNVRYYRLPDKDLYGDPPSSTSSGL
jgi:hypothetical protein